MGDDERKLASEYICVGDAIKKSLESGLKGTFVLPPPAVIDGADDLFQNALAAVSKDYRNGPLSYQNALHYSMMLGILRTVEPQHPNRDSLTKRLEELYTSLKKNLTSFSMEVKDAKSLIDICNIIVEMGESYNMEEHVRDIS